MYFIPMKMKDYKLLEEDIESDTETPKANLDSRNTEKHYEWKSWPHSLEYLPVGIMSSRQIP